MSDWQPGDQYAGEVAGARVRRVDGMEGDVLRIDGDAPDRWWVRLVDGSEAWVERDGVDVRIAEAKAEEPKVSLVARDRYAPDALEEYARRLVRVGLELQAQDVRMAAQAFRRWQLENPNEVSDPPQGVYAPPPHVVHWALGGE